MARQYCTSIVLKRISVLHDPLKFYLNLDLSMCHEYIYTKQLSLRICWLWLIPQLAMKMNYTTQYSTCIYYHLISVRFYFFSYFYTQVLSNWRNAKSCKWHMVLLLKSSSQNSQILKNLCLNNFPFERQYFTPSIPVGNTDICRYANWFWGKGAYNQMLNDVTDFFCHMLSPQNVNRTVNSKINAVKIAKLLLWLMKVRFCFFFFFTSYDCRNQ